jgi:hypothetical protein
MSAESRAAGSARHENVDGSPTRTARIVGALYLIVIVGGIFAEMVCFSFVGTAIEGVSLLAHYAPLVILGKASYLAAFSPAQLDAAAYVSLRLFEGGFSIALAFFGFFCIALGSLIARSTFFPRIIGWLLALQGALYLINSFAWFISPAAGARVFPFLAASSLGGEIAFCLGLLVMGVNAPQWKAQASAMVAA